MQETQRTQNTQHKIKQIETKQNEYKVIKNTETKQTLMKENTCMRVLPWNGQRKTPLGV